LDIEPPIPGYNRFISSYLLMGDKTAIVDPGPAAAIPGLMAGLHAAGVKPEQVAYIILTHIHIDHAGSTGALISRMPNAKVMAHSRAIQHLVDPSALWKGSLKTLGNLAMQYGEIEPVPGGRVIALEENMKVYLGKGQELQVYLTPGHAPHHLSLFGSADGLLLAGEAGGVCINGSIRPATPPPFKLEETLASIDKLIALNPQRICYGHFGCYDNAMERLKHARLQVTNWHRIANAEKERGRTPEQILEVLRMKDSELNYLNNLDSNACKREYTLLMNTIYGLSGMTKRIQETS
jgi:glyoxylase-like metal-dependent hydrolase (beta-lactamase superfamily II)